MLKFMLKKRHTPHKLGSKLTGDKLIQVDQLLDKYDYNMPGQCDYEHPITELPAILKRDPIPPRCKRSELETAFHYYNYKKYLVYEKIVDDAPLSAIIKALDATTAIRWQLVILCNAIVGEYVSRNPYLQQYHSDLTGHLFQIVDRLCMQRGIAPSTYVYCAVRRRSWKIMQGNANKKNLKISYAGESLDIYPSISGDPDHFEIADIANDYINLLRNDREKTIIHERFWSGRTLQEISEILGVTRERVRQIEKAAIDHMRVKGAQAQFPIV